MNAVDMLTGITLLYWLMIIITVMVVVLMVMLPALLESNWWKGSDDELPVCGECEQIIELHEQIIINELSCYHRQCWFTLLRKSPEERKKDWLHQTNALESKGARHV